MNKALLSSIAIGLFCIISLLLIVFGIPQPIKMISGLQQKEQPQAPVISLSPQHQQYQQQYMQIDNTNNINFNRSINTDNNNTTKLAILTFGDTLKSQITTAKPILDKYGFKASFFYYM